MLTEDPNWWRSAVVYQIYPRSFADADNDGIGDIRGMIDHLGHLAELGVDAIWVSPWYPSPMADGGYDVADYTGIHPDFGTLADADELIRIAHDKGIRIVIDLVANHCSDQHQLFAEALAAGSGSPERDWFIFRDGRGDGSEPPNNWGSIFGGPAWERITEPDGRPGQWYLHMFALEQPDFDWSNPAVLDYFDDVLRFWFDRGIDGFRVDVGDGMAKDMSLPDTPLDPATGFGDWKPGRTSPIWNQPGLADIQRRWRRVADEYAGVGARSFVSEANIDPMTELVRHIEQDRLHTIFNFDAMWCEWDANSWRNLIDITLAAHDTVTAPVSWVLGNHDVPRPATRYGKAVTGRRFTPDGVTPETRGWATEDLAGQITDLALGRRRARAAALLELALPGCAYIYQGEELGLDEVEDLSDEVRQDPAFVRSGGQSGTRDGCRVPLPWSGEAPPFGFSRDAVGWLPQPAHWAEFTVARQADDPDSTLALYKAALRIRRDHPALGDGSLRWAASQPDGVLCFERDPGFGCLVNFGPHEIPLPEGARPMCASAPLAGGLVPADTAVWYERPTDLQPDGFADE